MGWFPPAFMGNLPFNILGILSNDLLLAIPFFTLMGAILEKCGLAEDLLESMGQLFGPLRGGLGYSVIVVGFILGAITGTVAGQVIAMAMISLPPHDALRVRHALHDGCARGVGDHHPTGTPVAGARRDRGTARPVGGRHVQGRLGSLRAAGTAVRALHVHAVAHAAVACAGIAAGSPHAARLGAVGQVSSRDRSFCRFIFAVLGSMGGLPGISTAICTPTEAGAMGAVAQ